MRIRKPFCAQNSSKPLKNGICNGQNSEKSCKGYEIYLFMFGAILVFFGPYWDSVTIMNITIRSVPKNLQTQALSLQTTLARLLGSIPGPIAFGAILDTACVIWERDFCGDVGSCLLFNNEKTSYMFLALVLISRIVNGVCKFGIFLNAKEYDEKLNVRDRRDRDQ